MNYKNYVKENQKFPKKMKKFDFFVRPENEYEIESKLLTGSKWLK